MKILVLNCGSSSVKYKLIDMPAGTVVAQGQVEKLGLKGSFLKVKLPNGEKVILEKPLNEHTAAIDFILQTMLSKEYGCLKSLDEIGAVGHRLVHGGDRYSTSTLITEDVINDVNAFTNLAPLHNPATVSGVRAVTELLPKVPQVGVFDTAFQQSMPEYVYRYALPYEYCEKYGIRKYGFHGTSHRYISKRACEITGIDFNHSKIVTAHIGNGASMNAIVNGKVLDTSLGMTTMEGLIMGTRSGNLDAGALLFLGKEAGLSYDELSDVIYKKSGVVGVSGVSSDMREIEEAISQGNERAKLALKMYDYQIRKYLGALAAAMGGLDILVFAGGVGENQVSTREFVCDNMEFMGIEIDKKLNASVHGTEAVISTPNSRVKVLVVPTDEELMIASDTYEIVNK